MEEILIAESMAINITDAVLMVPLLIVVGGLGIAIGMYISSQIKCSISRRINNKELINNLENLEDEQEKGKD